MPLHSQLVLCVVREHAERREEELSRPIDIDIVPAVDASRQNNFRLVVDRVLHRLIDLWLDLFSLGAENAEQTLYKVTIALVITTKQSPSSHNMLLFFTVFALHGAQAVLEYIDEAFEQLDNIVLLVDHDVEFLVSLSLFRHLDQMLLEAFFILFLAIATVHNATQKILTGSHLDIIGRYIRSVEQVSKCFHEGANMVCQPVSRDHFLHQGDQLLRELDVVVPDKCHFIL